MHVNYKISFITVRLVDGGSYTEGRVEVYYSGRWGTVCNDGWNDNYVSLVCAQLGFGSSGKLADFGPGSGSIFLEKVMCSSNDLALASCGHYGVGLTAQCSHHSDVGVKCNGMYFCTYIYNITVTLNIIMHQYQFLSILILFRLKLTNTT